MAHREEVRMGQVSTFFFDSPSTSQNDLAKKNKRINKCLKMLREVKVRLAEMEGEACLYEAVVAVLREDDDA